MSIDSLYETEIGRAAQLIAEADALLSGAGAGKGALYYCFTRRMQAHQSPIRLQMITLRRKSARIPLQTRHILTRLRRPLLRCAGFCS